MLLIESNNFMTSSNLIYDTGGYKWSTDYPGLALSVDDSPSSFRQIAKIFGKDINPLIPDFYTNSANVLSIDPPWCFYIGKQKFLTMVDAYCEKHDEFFKNNDRLKIEMHIKISQFLKKLKPAKYSLSGLNVQELDRHIQSHITPNLEDGYLKTPIYSRTDTKTGRLKVVSGPNVLTMHSGLRKGLQEGYSIDFISMEPNLLLALQGHQPKIDIYETIRKDLFNDQISRTKVKIATMASLYGSGREDKIAKTISDYFGCEKMVLSLEKRVVDDTIKNEYGRLLNLNGARGRHLLSLWLQSSAADGAIYGFSNFYKQCNIIPHWIIHDGLIFIYRQEPSQIKELDIGLGINLPVKVEKL